MKVQEILREAIYNTLEYSLSSDSDKHSAFGARVPDLTEEDYDFYKITIPKIATIEINKKNVKVPIKLTSYGVLVITEPHKVPATKRQLVQTSAEVTEFKKKYSAVMSKRREEFEETLRMDLSKKLPPAAKLAINDNVLGLIHEKDFHAVRKWFEKNGFFVKGPDNTELPLPEADEFKNMTSLDGWVISTKEPYRNRGVDGRSMQIDWKDRKFYTIAWSSGD